VLKGLSFVTHLEQIVHIYRWFRKYCKLSSSVIRRDCLFINREWGLYGKISNKDLGEIISLLGGHNVHGTFDALWVKTSTPKNWKQAYVHAHVLLTRRTLSNISWCGIDDFWLTVWLTDRQLNSQTDRYIVRQAYRKTDSHIDTDSQTRRQTDRRAKQPISRPIQPALHLLRKCLRHEKDCCC